MREVLHRLQWIRVNTSEYTNALLKAGESNRISENVSVCIMVYFEIKYVVHSP